MTHDTLGQLLARADEAAGAAPRSSEGVANCIRAELRRRQARRRTATGVALALLLVVATLIPIVHSRPHRVIDLAIANRAIESRPPEVSRLRRELAALRAQANAGQLTVAAMLRAERRVRQSPARALADPVQRIYDQRDLAALALVRQADRLYRELDHRQSAATAYERVVELFPQTPSASVARQRLFEIKG
jgi:ribosomal protein L29